MAEVSVYIHSAAQGRGVGTALLEKLIKVSEAEAYWTLQAQILAPNTASRTLHSRCGFREVGHRERFGHINGTWHNVILMERRSEKAGGPGLPTRECN